MRMCNSLLGGLEKVRDDLRASEWTMIRAIEFNIVSSLFTSGEATIKRIIENLNLLSMVDKQRMDTCRSVAKEIIQLQSNNSVTDAPIRLLDLQRPLERILSVKAMEMIKDMIRNALQHFGITADKINYAACNLGDIEGSFNEPDFTSSLPCKLKIFSIKKWINICSIFSGCTQCWQCIDSSNCR